MNNQQLAMLLDILADPKGPESPSIPARTAHCPSLPLFRQSVRRRDWRPDELAHIAECAWCKRTQTIAVRLDHEDEEEEKKRWDEGCKLHGANDNLPALAIFDEIANSRSTSAGRRRSALLYCTELRRRIRKFNDGIKDATQVIDDPESPSELKALAYFNRGVLKDQGGDSAGAVEDWTLVLGIEGHTRAKEHALFHRGILKDKSRDSQGAKHDLAAVVEIGGDLVTKAKEKLSFIEKRDDDMSALKRGVIRLVLALQPELQCSLADQNLEGAIADLTSVIGEYSRVADKFALFCRGLVRVKLGDLDGALTDYALAIVAQNDCSLSWLAPSVFYNCALVRFNLARYADAIPDFSAAIDNPHFDGQYLVDAYFRRGIARGCSYDFQGAIDDFNVVTSLPSAVVEDLAWAFLNRAIAKVNLQDIVGAIADFDFLANNENAPPFIRSMAQERATFFRTDNSTVDMVPPGEFGIEPFRFVRALPAAMWNVTEQLVAHLL